MSKASHPIRFDRVLDLATLPWFGLEDGRLTVTDPDVGPAVDMHTHLALAHGRRMRVDLNRAHDCAQHYLPLDGALDLDVYMNRNFTDADLTRLKRDLALKGFTAGGMRATHTAPNLVAEMRALGIHTSVLLPIEQRALTWNAEAYLDVVPGYDALITFGSVHPASSGAADRLEAQKAAGARGVKLHPAVQLMAPDAPRCMDLYRVCADLDLPVLWHCGPVDIETRLGRKLCQLKNYWEAIAANPDTTFILGHSGALQFDRALLLANSYDNVWMEIASQGLPVVRRMLTEAPADRILFGSDWPFYHQAIPLAKVLIATEGDPAGRRRLLWENAARLLGLDG